MMTDDGSQPPIAQLATAVHRGHATRSWCHPLLLVLLGGVVVGVLCMSSDVYSSGVSFGSETHSIGNTNTVEVLVFNPNDPCISVQSERGSVTHSSTTAAEKGIWLITDRRLRLTQLATAVQRRWACHTRTVVPADAYGRQRFNVLSACSVVYLWYMPGLCAYERATKTDIF